MSMKFFTLITITRLDKCVNFYVVYATKLLESVLIEKLLDYGRMYA